MTRSALLCPNSYLVLDPVQLEPRLQLETERRDGGDLKTKMFHPDILCLKYVHELTCGDLVN